MRGDVLVPGPGRLTAGSAKGLPFGDSDGTPRVLSGRSSTTRAIAVDLRKRLSLRFPSRDAPVGARPPSPSVTAAATPTLRRLVMSDYPAFAWSHTRDRALQHCARSYYWRWYGGSSGWRDDAPSTTRRAYALRQLTTLSLSLGAALHDCAAECARSVVEGRPLPSFETLRERVRAQLNALWTSRDVRQFLRSPRGTPMLREWYYHGVISPEAVQHTRERMTTCLENLVGAPLWDELRRADPTTVVVPDGPSLVEVAGTPAYLVPDLLFRGNLWTIVDWKTGRPGDDVWDQIAVYGLILSEVMHLPLEEGFEGCVCFLETGEVERCRLTATDLAWARERITSSTERMRRLLSDPERNVPLGRDVFAMTRDRSRCLRCNFLELCWSD